MLSLTVSLMVMLNATPDLITLEREVQEYMDILRSGTTPAIRTVINKYPFTSAEELALLDPYFYDDSEPVRSAAVVCLSMSGMESLDSTLRQLVTGKLVSILRWEPRDVFSSIVVQLVGFRRGDFTDDTRQELSRKLLEWLEEIRGTGRGVRYPRELVKLVAMAELHEAMPVIQSTEAAYRGWSDHHPLDGPPREAIVNLNFWCIAARAQLGDDAALQRVQNIYGKLESDVNKTTAMYAISIILRPEAIEMIRPLLYSSEKIPGPTGRTEGDPQADPVAHMASAVLSQMLEGYPRYLNIEECRQWMNRRPPGFKWEFKR